MKLFHIKNTTILFLFLLTIISNAQDGTLDHSFDMDGKVTTSINLLDSGKGVAIQDDRKIIVAGYTNQSTTDICLTRYNTDGSLDNSFGVNGVVITDIDSSSNFAQSIAIQPDGKIVVAGFTYNSVTGNDYLLLRYNSNGSLDTTFNSTGFVVTAIDSLQDIAKKIVVQPDGKLVVAGYTLTYIDYNQYYSYYDFAIVRYNSDGSLDNSFGTNGIVTTSISDSSTDAVSDIALQSDGKIVVTGNSQIGFESDFAIARYNTDGSLDSSFGSNGKVTTSIDSIDASNGISIQSDGKIVIVGTSYQSTNPAITVLRYNSNGTLDNTFDNDGIVTTQTDSLSVANSVFTISNQKIIVAGYTFNGSESDFVLARYNNNGSLDSTFHYDGIVRTDFGSTNDIAYDAALMLYGKRIVAVGSSSGSNSSDIAIAVYNSSPPPVSVNNQDNSSLIKQFKLSQNYPNPFNPTTTIKYTISYDKTLHATSQPVQLKVYDMLGREIATLVNEKQPAGTYQINFNGSNLSSGIYYYTLKTNNFVKTKNMILIK